jgi:transposase InsO family protein
MMAIGEIAAHTSISRACFLIGIPRRSYYARKTSGIRIASSRVSTDTVQRIRDICHERVTYGYRRVWALLRNEGISINEKTVLKIMRNENLSLESHVHRNRKGWRSLSHPKGPDELWETDLTYIPTLKEGMTYLFNIKDCFTKEWMGYFYSRTCNRKDALKSIEDSVMRYPDRYPDAVVDGINLRSDNGDQYTSHYLMDHVKAMGFRQEFIEKSTPEQDGDIESFHMSLKTDYIWVREIKDFSEGERIIENAFNDYNNIRPHSSIEYLAPKVFRERYLNDAGFRSMYNEKLENRKNKKRERNKMRWNGEKIREAI